MTDTASRKFLEDGSWAQTWAPLPIHVSPPVNAPEIKLRDYDVTPDDLRRFKDKGYFVAPKLLDDDAIAFLRKEIDRCFRGEVDTVATPYEYEYWMKAVVKHRAGSPDVRKINNGWWINRAVKSVVTSRQIGRIAAKLLGTPEIRLWHDQLITKPGAGPEATSAGNIGWHQDYGYWQISNLPEMITAWVALQDTDMTNGAMRTITRSHNWGLLPEGDFFTKDMEGLTEKYAKYAEGKGAWEDEPCVMKAGQVAFHHALTIHGSGQNFTNEPRMAVAVHMQSKDVGYQSGHGWHHNLRDMGPDVKVGDLFVGPAFPVLYSEKE